MTTIELIDAVNVLLDDELPSDEILTWLQSALYDLGNEVGAVFPEITLEEPPVIHDRYLEALVLYASAQAKFKDSSLAEGDRFLSRYDQKKADFARTYTVPREYRESNDESDLEYPPSPFPSYWRW